MYVYVGYMHLYIHLVLCVCIYMYIYIYYTILFSSWWFLVIRLNKTFFKFPTKLDLHKICTQYFEIFVFGKNKIKNNNNNAVSINQFFEVSVITFYFF